MRRSLRTFLRTWTRRSFRTSPGSLRRSYSKLSFQLWRPTLRHPWGMSLSTSMHCYQNCCISFTPLLDTECTAEHALDMLCFQLSYIRSYVVIRPPLLLLVEILTKRGVRLLHHGEVVGLPHNALGGSLWQECIPPYMNVDRIARSQTNSAPCIATKPMQVDLSEPSPQSVGFA
jgi:hypothetical protein